MEEILLIDKPAGWTSFDVVAKIRGKVRSEFLAKGLKPTKRQLKVGHAGTLDPFATGLLIVLLGDACKDADKFLKLEKSYEFTARLGQVSTTGDPEGAISEKSSFQPSFQEVEQALKKFTGNISQKPPIYSAIKVNGKRAYKLAREGKSIEMPTRTVSITLLEVVDYSYPNLKCICHVSSGTYIRTLAEDIGHFLGTGAYCSELRRTQIGKYNIQDARVRSVDLITED